MNNSLNIILNFWFQEFEEEISARIRRQAPCNCPAGQKGEPGRMGEFKTFCHFCQNYLFNCPFLYFSFMSSTLGPLSESFSRSQVIISFNIYMHIVPLLIFMNIRIVWTSWEAITPKLSDGIQEFHLVWVIFKKTFYSQKVPNVTEVKFRSSTSIFNSSFDHKYKSSPFKIFENSFLQNRILDFWFEKI